MAHAEHLARHGLADLFLDTLPCNAHTTASDALWAGLPMLTCMGETFAGRVGASVLKAVGLRELIAQDLAQYEALAFDLALEPKRLQSIKQKLASNRDTSPLFDTARLTRNIESAYEAMWERHQRGLAPEHVRVAVDDKPSVIDEAIALHRKGRLAEAVALYQRAIGWNPRNADALHLLGVAKFQSNDPIRGLSLIDQAISIDPANATYFCNRGAILQAVKRSEEALESCDRALALRPDYADALYNRGLALHDLRRFSDAVTSHDRALAVQPNHAGALAGSGHALQELERFPEALASYEDALAIDKNLADVARCHGDVLRRLNRLEEAITSYERSLAVKPDMPFLPGLMAMCKLRICDWRGLDDAIARLVRNIEAGQAASSPFPALALPLSSADQRSCAERYVRRNHPKSAALPPLGSYRHDRIRIGYFSADFRSHAVAYLMAEVFERHDRSAFEVMAFFFTAATKDSMRDRLEASFDRMADVSSLSDKDIALLARRHEIDIAVDLMGFTRYSRTGIFAFRAAPVQVNYLGFPGTMGAEYIDYLIADETVIPEGQDTHYAEKIAYLPHTYQPNDSTRKIGPKPFTRTECKLPDAGVVFCCFNKTYKIQPAMFDVWMRLLHRVSGSVLWLFSTDPIAMRNLKAAAHARGIDPARLVFAERLPLSDHLARHRVADLFLDTLPYNAHTTASDALWAGLPMITCLGETFAGRVGASVLRALGLPELVTHNVAEYEALAYEIATHPQQLASIRRTLDVNRAIHPLFDTPRFTKYLESAYRAMWQRHQQGLAPAHVRVHPGT
jgi:predicted O-linked N-acetylglucosamine transferase (SPINDLY family)